MKKLQHRKIYKREFNKGDTVIFYNSKMHLVPEKLKFQWSRPFRVIEVHANGVVKVEKHKGYKFKINGQRLKKYYGEPLDVRVVHGIDISNT